MLRASILFLGFTLGFFFGSCLAVLAPQPPSSQSQNDTENKPAPAQVAVENTTRRDIERVLEVAATDAEQFTHPDPPATISRLPETVGWRNRHRINII